MLARSDRTERLGKEKGRLKRPFLFPTDLAWSKMGSAIPIWLVAVVSVAVAVASAVLVKSFLAACNVERTSVVDS